MKAIHRAIVRLFIFFLITACSFARHNLAPEYSYTYIQTTRKDAFHLYSPSVNYTGDFKTGAFRVYLGASALLPLWARQDGDDFYNPDYYSHIIGTDLFIGLARDVPVIDRFDLIPVFGWHLSGIRLRGKPQTMDFYSLVTGFGFRLLTRYQGNQDLINYGFLSSSYDFIDLLYQNNRLKRGHTISFGIGHTF
jgi:hypothetical protein